MRSYIIAAAAAALIFILLIVVLVRQFGPETVGRWIEWGGKRAVEHLEGAAQ